MAVFEARAVQAVGAATLKVTASSGDLTSVEALDVPLLPAAPKSRRVQRIELDEGVLDLKPRLHGWLPMTERSTFWVTANPYGDAFDHLKHLVRYPYGCVEQTTSSTRPLLFLPNLLHLVDPSLVAAEALEDMVRHGIDRILSMQTPSGGFAYWPGGTEPAYWGTAYASHLLLDAQKLRYPVPQGRIDDALEWMEGRIAHHYEAGEEESSWYTSNAEPYMHFVLALAGRPRKARAEKLIEQIGSQPEGEEREHLAMLQAALYLAGDHRYERQLRRPDLSPVAEERDNGWSFYSDRRRRGFLLSTVVDLFGRDEAFRALADQVAEGLRAHPSAWYTTQELVWGITGLGKFVEAGARELAPTVLRIDGRAVEPEPPRAGQTGRDQSWSLARASEYQTVTLEVPRKGPGKLYLILSSEGVREVADYRFGGEGLSLRRRHLDSAGNPVDLGGGSHALGDLVFVELTLANTSAERIANIALVDRIPAGWEIENPRLGRGRVPEWVDPDRLWDADHLDLRDDRVEIFGHLKRGETRQIVYAVRAVTAGRFTLPSAEAEAMYDPRIWARQQGGEVEVLGPWPE